MGKLTYEGSVKADFDDRILAHLQVVIGSKLRRGESFVFTWPMDAPREGRTSVWIHPMASLVFNFSGSRTPAVNGAWLDALNYTANSPTGLHVVPEPGA